MARNISKKTSKLRAVNSERSDEKELTSVFASGNQLLKKLMSTRSSSATYYPNATDLALDYPTSLDYYDYLYKYTRQDIAQRIIQAPVGATWRYSPNVFESDEEETPFEIEYAKLLDKLDLYNCLKRLDLLAGLGKYAILYLGFDDSENLTAPPRKGSKLLYLTPIPEPRALISTWDTSIRSSGYGHPLMYSVQIASLITGETIGTRAVHWSRVIHVAENTLDNEFYGLPRLECVYNRLLGLEKLAGGSPEMYWRGARPGYTAQAAENTTLSDSQLEGLKGQLSDFVNNLQRWLYVEGLNIQSLAPQVVSPTDHVDVQLQLISAATRIPIRILVGSERGELASSQDERAWLSFIEERRQEVADRLILRPLINRLIDFNVLPQPDDSFYIEWEPLLVLSDKEKAEIGKIHTETLSKYLETIGGTELIPPELFLSRELGMSTAEIELAKNIIEDEAEKDNIKEDEEETIEKKETINENSK